MERLVPCFLHARETRVLDRHPRLMGDEGDVVSGAVERRRCEFSTVRSCARDALAQLLIGPVPIVPGEGGSPIWPDGVVGSMTHCAGFYAAVVSVSSRVRSVGIDAEPNRPLPDGLIKRISTDGERVVLPSDSSIAWGRLLFSAKESVYKAWFPVKRRFLNFDQVIIKLDVDGVFSATVTDDAAGIGLDLTNFNGRWLMINGIIGTAVTVPLQGAQSGGL